MAQVTRNMVGGRCKIYRDTFTGGTPETLDVHTDLNKYAVGGTIQNMSETEDLYVYLSNDGVNYNSGKSTGGTEYYLLKAYGIGSVVSAAMSIDGMQIKKIKLDCASGQTGSYQVMVF